MQVSINKKITALTMIAVVGVCSYMASPALQKWVEPQSEIIAQETKSYIIKAENYTDLLKSMDELGVTPSHTLKIIDSIAVDLTEHQLRTLRDKLPIKVTENHQVKLSNWKRSALLEKPLAVVPEQIDATLIHYYLGNYGQGVTIGYLDTGLDQLNGLGKDLFGHDKAWGTYDAINDVAYNIDKEGNGHGTHITSVSNNSNLDIDGFIYGVAPNAASVSIKAFDDEGKGSYADVIRGIEWALEYKDAINLRVLNMSFSGPVMSYYWDDPLNQAVMTAWQQGVVVIASAGNTGPDPMTIGVPGNVPYIITVGAMTDSYTPFDSEDDVLTTFSAAGPTIEGFVKPEIIAPGGHIAGMMSLDTMLATEHPEFHDGGRYFEMSGTSQAAAVVSGVAALLLTQDPSLTPDQVKCKLIASAHAALNDDGSLAYSVFQQGAGMVNAVDAILSDAMDCANRDMDIARDLSGEQHYFGPANIDENGNFYVTDMPDSTWYVVDEVTSDGGFLWRTTFDVDGGFLWRTNFDTNGGFLWRTALTTDGGFLWRTNFEVDGGFLWRTTFDTNGGFLWRTAVVADEMQTIAINHWVEQE